jgi:hypothetical protein
MSSPGLACAVALAAAIAPAAAAASGEVAPPVDLAGVVAAAGDDAPIFFGGSGQIYQLAGQETWRRGALGGVATRVAGIVKARSGALFAVGDSTPLYRRVGGVWYTHELANRGASSIALGGGVAALGVGPHVYLLDGDEWKRRGRAPDEIAAIWASDPHRIYLATRAGELHRGDGRNFRPIAHGLDDDDRITGLVGQTGQELYAIAASGAVLQVGGQRAREASVPAELGDRRIDAAGYLPDGTPAIAVAIPPAGESGEDGDAMEHRAALVALRGGALTVEAWLPPLASGDRIAAIGSRDGASVIATQHGTVAIRDGDTWRAGRVSTDFPPPARRAGDGSRPARSP